MNVIKALKTNRKELWDEYCHFLDLDIDQYMEIQKNLLMEQIALLKDSQIGKRFIKEDINSIEDFKSKIRLTEYSDYYDILLNKDENAIPQKADLWIQTTWEGGLKPIKVAPYTRKMLDIFRDNTVACYILGTSRKKYDFKAENNDTLLYGLAPLPYLTGLLPKVLGEATDIKFLPDVDKAVNMSFSQRNKEGFKMALSEGLDIFFGLGSVCYAVSKQLLNGSGSRGGKSALFGVRPDIKRRLVLSKIKSVITRKPMVPKDIFKAKTILVAGTDNKYYKKDLEKLWGCKPFELFAGTEPSLIGCENWERNGMYFFPNTCFYEFISFDEVIKNKLDPAYVPSTVLLNEVKPGETYECVITVFHGGTFVRYRVGDLYKCIAKEDKKNNIKIPRFEYVDRVPWVIDVAGFTRFTEDEIKYVISNSKSHITSWYATKGFDDNNKPYLKLYVETNDDIESLHNKLKEEFVKYDDDFSGLEKILGFDPLKIHNLPKGLIENYKKNSSYFLRVNSILDPFIK